MITGRSGAAERSARLTSGLSGLAERRPRRTQEDTGRRRADVETWKRADVLPIPAARLLGDRRLSFESLIGAK